MRGVAHDLYVWKGTEHRTVPRLLLPASNALNNAVSGKKTRCIVLADVGILGVRAPSSPDPLLPGAQNVPGVEADAADPPHVL